MAVKDDNKLIGIVLPKEYIEYLEERRKKEGRSMSNMAAFLLKTKIDEEKRS